MLFNQVLHVNHTLYTITTQKRVKQSIKLIKNNFREFFLNLDNGGHFGKQNGFRKHENIAIFRKLVYTKRRMVGL